MTAVNRRGRKRPLVILAVILVVILAAVAAIFLLRSRNASSNEWSKDFRRVTVESIAYQESAEISGNLEPLEARDLAFSASGKVVEVPVREGDIVAKGALVARQDNQSALYELALIESSLEKMRYSAPARDIEHMELERNIKAQAVSDRELRSPISGRLSAVEVQAGDFVAAGRKVARVVNVSSLKAKVQIDELDAPRVKIGLPVRFYFDALPELQVTGRVSSLSVEGRITPEGLAVLDGEVRIDRPPAALLAGFSFTGDILLGEEQTVLVLPKEALMKEKDKTFVYLLSESRVDRREVEASALDEERIRIRSGLAKGDEVLVPLSPVSTEQSRAQITTTGLLQTLRGRIRLPFLGGGSPSEGASEDESRPAPGGQ
jgi:multidrug efflux pump subunit AcrA (membrane-fusion protein)